VAVAVPALGVLLNQGESVWVLVVSKADLQGLHAFVTGEEGVVGTAGRDVDFIGEEQGGRADDAVAGVESAGLRDRASVSREVSGDNDLGPFNTTLPTHSQ
jgi:hypothetical protein